MTVTLCDNCGDRIKDINKVEIGTQPSIIVQSKQIGGAQTYLVSFEFCSHRCAGLFVTNSFRADPPPQAA